MVVVVVDLVVLAGSVAGVVLVVVVVDLVMLAGSVAGVVLVVVVVDLVASEPGTVLVVVVDFVTSSAALRASSIIVAISMATNIFFIPKPLFSCDLIASCCYPLALFIMCLGTSDMQS